MFDVWKNVLAEIEKNISPASFATWFKNINLVSTENGTIIISIPNIFYKKQLEGKYHKFIEDAFKSNNIDFTNIEYVIKTKNTKVKSRETTGEKNKIKPEKFSHSSLLQNSSIFLVFSSN